MSSPFKQVLVVLAVVAAIIATAVGTGYYFTHRTPDLKTTGSRTPSAPAARASLPGDPMLPDAAAAYDRADQQNRERAEQSAGAAASVRHIDTLGPVPGALPEARPHDAALERQRRETEDAAKKQVQEHEKLRLQAIEAQSKKMGKVLAAWGGTHKTVEAPLKPPEPEKAAGAGEVAVHDPLANLSVDKVYYGLLQVFISSDEPGPVVVTVKDGELAGARLIGSFKRADEKVVIRFDRMTYRKAWYTVDAVAINPENGRLGLATDVDRRTLSRWAALLGSSLLQGAQRAYLSQGTQSSYLWGESSTHNYSDKEILGIAVGEIGTRTRTAANRYFDRPPTVYVDPAIQLVGVLFMAPPERKTQGQTPLAAALDARHPQGATPNVELLREANAALDGARPTPRATQDADLAAASEDPGTDTRNYTRRPVGLPAVAVPDPMPDSDFTRPASER